MFGTKKTIPINEFGFGVLRYADNFITADAGRSLGTQFENWDGSQGWWNFLQSKGMSSSILKLYQTLYTHCVMQTVFKGFSPAHRWEMVHGAMTRIADLPEGYNLNETFSELEAVFDGEFKFSPNVEPLNSESLLHFIASPRVGILASKYLIEKFVIANMEKRDAFITNFHLYSSTIGSSVGTANRAMDQLLSKFKIGPQQSPPKKPAEFRLQPSPARTANDTAPKSPFTSVADKPQNRASKPIQDWDGFKISEAIYFQAIGVGHITDVEKFDGIEGEIERFIIEFDEDETELHIPVHRLREMSLRKPAVFSDDPVDEDETPILESNGFKVGEHVVYPVHGVGKIIAIEKMEIAGAMLQVFVINFKTDNMTLRVPTDKYKDVGMRRLADEI